MVELPFVFSAFNSLDSAALISVSTNSKSFALVELLFVFSAFNSLDSAASISVSLDSKSFNLDEAAFVSLNSNESPESIDVALETIESIVSWIVKTTLITCESFAESIFRLPFWTARSISCFTLFFSAVPRSDK